MLEKHADDVSSWLQRRTSTPNITYSHPQVVITCALRTPFTKGGKGGFKDTQSADLLHGAFKALIERSGIDPSLVEDIAVGSVLAPGGGATEFRAAALAAGFPVTAAVKSLNRQCSSGLQACVDIANAIGTPIYALTDGVVDESGPASGFGMWVVLRHPDGERTVYGHVNRSYVTPGQQVRAGEHIADIGNRGFSTGPHLHLEVWAPDGTKLNPLAWLARHGIRL